MGPSGSFPGVQGATRSATARLEYQQPWGKWRLRVHSVRSSPLPLSLLRPRRYKYPKTESQAFDDDFAPPMTKVRTTADSVAASPDDDSRKLRIKNTYPAYYLRERGASFRVTFSSHHLNTLFRRKMAFNLHFFEFLIALPVLCYYISLTFGKGETIRVWFERNFSPYEKIYSEFAVKFSFLENFRQRNFPWIDFFRSLKFLAVS